MHCNASPIQYTLLDDHDFKSQLVCANILKLAANFLNKTYLNEKQIYCLMSLELLYNDWKIGLDTSSLNIFQSVSITGQHNK